jgi:phosphoglycolate phosphatase
MLPRLVLFDIDGTILRPTGVGRRSLEQAFADRYGVRGAFDGVRFHGRADPEIVGEGLRRVGRGADEIPRAIETYLRHLDDEVSRLDGDLLLPGAAELVRRLRATGSVTLGLVTGNVRRGAEIKLGRAGIFGAFEVGAFGDDSCDRAALIRLAAGRARSLGCGPFGPGRTFHVGDTGEDVRAAHEAGVVAVAVATGSVPEEELLSARPHHLRHGFEPVDLFLEEVLG